LAAMLACRSPALREVRPLPSDASAIAALTASARGIQRCRLVEIICSIAPKAIRHDPG
jgi:hypothetical protein